MDDKPRGPVATPACCVPQSARHQSLVRKACKTTRSRIRGCCCAAGFALLKKRHAAIGVAGISTCEGAVL